MRTTSPSVLPSEEEASGLVLGPDTVAWDRVSDLRGFMLAGYALLLQVSHPTVGAGVSDHSDFESEPWDRLLRTVDYVNLSVYGGDEAVAVGRRLRELHRTIKGHKPDGERYHALEPEAFAWVHATLADSIVEAHARFARPMSPGEVQRFYGEFAGAGRLVGVRRRDLPPDWASFRAYFDGMVAERLEHTESVDRVLRALHNSPPPPMIPDRVWRVLRVAPRRALWLGTVGPLPPVLRARFGITWTRANERELRALGAAMRALTPVLPQRAKVSGPDYLRWRRRDIARGPLGAGADGAPHGVPAAAA